jgi:cytochrome c oxidase accessory protein FixG
MCVVLCPYGRLQSVLLDDDSLVVGYDEARGEPRGKVGKTEGDCVDCNRCVVVCPTGIDIRNGLQLDCIACTACIDACDEVMDKLGRPRGLVRYDSPRGLRGEKRRVVRPRMALYTALLFAGAGAALFATRARAPFEANLVRLPGPPFTREGGVVRNAFEIHLVNKAGSTERFTIAPAPAEGASFVVPMRELEIESLGSRRVPIFVTSEPRAGGAGAASGAKRGAGGAGGVGGAGGAGRAPLEIRVTRASDDGTPARTVVVRGVFLGASP